MAETSLRAYVREIDDLIEHDQLDEAIAHARHILQTYPRHLETYRLLGKAYLEAKRFGDAADLFQRVLSATPDDFVSHVGMSVVREDEGNLDAAIWHMERAFETNPSNAAVQGELRRLIGRRDGLEPHKVRLTRGALARMYANGELLPQAIAELHAALQEDPDRPDLQVLLAEMYWRTNHRAEAGEVAGVVLASLPNCRDANRILASVLHSQGRTEEALTYHRRVAALDPYSALVESIQDDPARVDPNSVRIEKLIWQPGQSVGMDTGPASRPGARASAVRPSWLDSLGAATATGAAAAASRKPPEPQPAPELMPEPVGAPESAPSAAAPPIPEWMQAAGWQPSDGDVSESPVSFSDDELRSLEAGMLPPEPAPESEDGLARANIPEWLKDVAPSESGFESAEPSSPPPATGASTPPGPEGPRLPAGWSAPPGGAGDEDDDWLRAAAEDAPALPTWMEEQSPGATATIVTWLGDRSKQEGRAEPPAGAAEAPQAPEPARLPEWLAEQAPAVEGTGTPPPTPGWLSGVAEAAARGSSIAPEEVQWSADEEEPIQTGMYPENEPPPEPAEMPEWLQTIAGRGGIARPSSADSPGSSPTPEWLQPPAPRAPQPEASAAGSEEGFAWLRELAESEPPTPKADDSDAQGLGEAPAWMSPPVGGARSTLGQSAGPEWLRGIGEPEPEPLGQKDSTSLDWLRGIAEPSEEPAAEATVPTEAPGREPKDESAEWLNLLSPSDTQPQPGSTGEWLRLLKQDGMPAQGPGPTLEPAVRSEIPPSAAPGGELDDEQVFGWLESLAAKQGIPAPEAIPPSPLGPGFYETPPIAHVAPVAPVAEPGRRIPEEPEAGMQWLEELAQETSPAVSAPPAAPSEILPAQPPRVEPETTGTPWAVLPETPRPTPSTGAPPPAPPAAEEPMPSPEAPDWLMELVAAAAQSEAEPAAGQPRAAPADETLPALPEWMLARGPAEEEPTVPPLPPVRVEPESVLEPAPIDELAETWVPPWEQLAIDEPGLEAEPAAPEPMVSPKPEAPIPAPAPEPMMEAAAEPEPAAEPAVPTVPRYVEPTTDVLEEVPDWLRTPAPRRREAPPPTPPPTEDELEVPDWLARPAAVAAPVVEPVQPPEAARPAPPPPTPVVEVAAEVRPAETPAPVSEIHRPEPVPPSLPPAAAAPRPPVLAPKPKAARADTEDRLMEARHALAVGDYRRAASSYGAVIKKKYKIAEVTSDLEAALDRNPKAADLWQALGDAYMKVDHLEAAIEAYQRGVAAA